MQDALPVYKELPPGKFFLSAGNRDCFVKIPVVHMSEGITLLAGWGII